MRHIRTLAALGLTVFAVTACGRRPQSSGMVAWSGAIPAGGILRLRNLSGPITVERGTSDKVTVRATKHWRHGRVDDARFDVEQSGNEVLVCTIYGRGSNCDAKDYKAGSRHHWLRLRSTDMTVDYSVELPPGVKIDASTVQGPVRVTGASSDVFARSVNGNVDVASGTGPVEAETVNGSVTARIDSAAVAGNVTAETVNGSVEVELPPTFTGSLNLATITGKISSEFPLTMDGGNLASHHVHATVGTGGREVELKTVNGSVSVRKRA